MRIKERQPFTDRTVDDWEARLGEQFRSIRIASGRDQTGLAEDAGISVGALRGLERGTGSSLRTVVRVARALGREDWLESISPRITVSPLDLVRTGKPARARVYRARREG
jgi:transcriptional regulator with XRE-family HTH domain